MKKQLLVALMFGVSTLAACGGSSEAPKAPETKPAASAPATPAPAASAPAATPAPTPAPATPAPVPAPAATGPLADLIKSTCECTTPECGTKAMSDLVALGSAGTAIDLQSPDLAKFSECIMATGMDKNEFISKMRQLRQQ